MEQKRIFCGDFCKNRQFISHKLSQEQGWQIQFDEYLYQKVEADIRMILGKKNKYDIFEAMEYFQMKYLAHRIPWKYVQYYYEPLGHRDSYSRNAYITFHESYLREDETIPFRFEHEDNITLVIDTFYNKELRKMYPSIIELENYFKESQQDFYKEKINVVVEYATNPIVVIGTIDNHTINSMARFYGATNELAAIPDIDYEIWYFHEHS